MRIMELLKILPHRYPFLLIDKIIEVVPGKRVIVQKNVSYNEPWCKLDLYEKPIMPRSLLIEIMAQSSFVLLCSNEDDEKSKEKFGLLCSIKEAKILKSIVPGDIVIVKTEIVDQLNDFVKVSSICYVDDEIAASAEMSLLKKN